jgi:hypothetical protein
MLVGNAEVWLSYQSRLIHPTWSAIAFSTFFRRNSESLGPPSSRTSEAAIFLLKMSPIGQLNTVKLLTRDVPSPRVFQTEPCYDTNSA